MVGFDLETQCKPEQGGSQQGFPQPAAGFFLLQTAFSFQCGPIGIDQGGQHPRQEGDGLHLGVVAHLDNLDIIGTEGHRHRSAQGQDALDSQAQHEQEGAQQRNEQIGGRPFAGEQEIIDLLRPVALARGADGGCGHAAEHGVRPGRRVIGMCFVPLRHLVRHADIAGDVALVYDFAGQDLRHEAVCQDQKQGYRPHESKYLFFHIVHPSSLCR